MSLDAGAESLLVRFFAGNSAYIETSNGCAADS
jgi:hypothetical protein